MILNKWRRRSLRHLVGMSVIMAVIPYGKRNDRTMGGLRMIGRSRGKVQSHKIDILYGFIALIIFIMSVMALGNPDENMVLFPFIFFFAFILRLFVFIERRMEEGKRKYIQLVIALALLTLSVVSGISLWT